jgi:membrane-bound lytic murein transglycosylase A
MDPLKNLITLSVKKMSLKPFSLFGWIGVLILLSSCASVTPTPLPPEKATPPPSEKPATTPSEKPTLSPTEKPAVWQLVPNDQWPDMADDLDYGGLERAVSQSLTYLRNRAKEQTFFLGTRHVSTEDLAATLRLFLKILKEEGNGKAREQRIRTHFDLYWMIQDSLPLPLLVTGYYEPSLKGSRAPSPRFNYPIYRLPDDFIFIHPEKFSPTIPAQRWVGRLEGNQVLPYYTRKEIDQEGRLAGKKLEILWVDDPMKLFFLHIQGSGEVSLEDGSVVKLGYHGANGHPYFAIGRDLVRRGLFKPEEISLQSIYTYLQNHPEERQALMNLNASYVFFKENRGGPFGSLGRPLTPGRSVAMDLKVFPPAGLAWLKGDLPAINNRGEIGPRVPLGRWVCLQDSGGAIRGPTRLDLFWGKGPEAELIAGHLRHPGTIFFLLKK